MSYEIRKHAHLTPSERRALVYEKEPVDTLAELWEKYPEGSRPGCYCLVKSAHALFGWNEEAGDWTPLGEVVYQAKHDKSAGMLVRLLPPGVYSEQQQIVPGEVMVVPLDAGCYSFYDSHYPRNRQALCVEEEEVGQVVLFSADGVIWEKRSLPVYDYLRSVLEKLEHNRGLVSSNPNQVSFQPAPRRGDYVYYRGPGDATPFVWDYTGTAWQKTTIPMPAVQVAPLTEYARHGYTAGQRVKTLAQVEAQVETRVDVLGKEIESLNDNLDGGNAFSVYGGSYAADGGDAFTKFE